MADGKPGSDLLAGKMSRLGWLVRSYAVPAIVALVALHQMYRVHWEGLSSWRGGGLGMYAGFHPRHNDVWLTRSDTGQARRYAVQEGTEDEWTRIVRPCLTYVNASCFREAVARLPDEWRGHARIQAWRLDFDTDTLRLSRERLLEFPPGVP